MDSRAHHTCTEFRHHLAQKLEEPRDVKRSLLTFNNSPPTKTLPGGARRSARLLDDMVGPEEQCLRNCDTKRLRSLHVDHQLKLGGLFYGEIGRLGAFEDFVDVIGSAAVQVREVGAILRRARPVEEPLSVARVVSRSHPGRHCLAP